MLEINSNMGCIETTMFRLNRHNHVGLMVIWDVLKRRNQAGTLILTEINSNMGCIETKYRSNYNY